MLNRKLLLVITIIIATASCNYKSNYLYELKQDAKSDFIISLDSITAADTKMIQFVDSEDKRSNLFTIAMLNTESQSINIHDVNGLKVKEIKLSDIDSLLSNTSGFYFIDTDSLLIYSYKQRDLRLASITNKFKPKLLFNLDSLNVPSTSRLDVNVNSKSPIIYNKGTVYLTGRAMLNNEISVPQAKKISTAMSFNINTAKANFYSMFENVWEERYWHFEQYYLNHAFLPEYNTIIYSTAMKDSIILYNLQSNNQVKTSARSDKLGSENNMIPKEIFDPAGIGSKDDLESYLEKPRYGEIIFDKYRRIYYRFITSGNKKRNTNLIIYEATGKKIGETQLSKDYMSGAGSFVAKKGLFLRKCNTKDESKIIFTLFKISKND